MASLGAYTTLAELQEDVGGTVESDGIESDTWKTQSKAWGLLQQLSSSEEIIHNQRRTLATFSFETWYQPGLKITSNWRLKLLDGRLLYLAANPNNVDNRNRTWIFTIQERA